MWNTFMYEKSEEIVEFNFYGIQKPLGPKTSLSGHLVLIQ